MKWLLAFLFGLWTSIAFAASPAFDSSGGFGTGGTGGTGGSFNLTTAGTNRVILAIAVADRTSSPSPTASISGCGLTWTKRIEKQQNNGSNNWGDVAYFTAPASSQLSACSVTASWTGGTLDDWVTGAVGVSGTANINAPFDSNVGIPYTLNSGPSVAANIGSIATSQNDDLFIGVYGDTSGTSAAANFCIGSPSSTTLSNKVSESNAGGTNFAHGYIAGIAASATVTGMNFWGNGSSACSGAGPGLTNAAVVAMVFDALTSDAAAASTPPPGLAIGPPPIH